MSTKPASDDVIKSVKDIDKVLEDKADDNQSECSEEDKVYRVKLTFIPVFLLEILALGCLAILAYFLRFDSKFPIAKYGFNLCDYSISLPKDPSQTNYSLPLDIQPTVLYASVFGFPLIMIAAGELLYFIFSSKPRKVIRAGCIHCKMHKLTRRIIRFAGTYMFGLLFTSILTDALKLSTGRHRPYFIEECGVNNTVCQSTKYMYISPFQVVCKTPEDKLREARMSFPSAYASLSAYAAVFIMIYIHNIMSTRSSRLLRPSLILIISGLALVCGCSRIGLHRNHWSDVVVGFLLGGGIGVYISCSILTCFKEYHETKHNQCCKREDYDDKRTRPLFFRYFRIPHVSFHDRSGKPYFTTDRDGFHGTMPVNEAFQKDLHKHVENYGKRHKCQA
ncbi:phospholipid phosphatase-related protein type 5-like [Centruroides sculpturatus]|uniref:phospholipid phosphatase-related protein type 5-like n=1 Tax=Centruroides sculpturatus TaxID=218467 RepID=UPI000C6CA766|nr:phospholipid phosphatase-related protein type 5-like [Centruroides sculpturatus]XP_023228758.1 phospholipid phosphatase-related protein type 5-like [Centruroides sculpturatus]